MTKQKLPTTNLSNSRTWKRFPIKVSQKIAKEMQKKCMKAYHWKEIQYMLSIYFLEIAIGIRNADYDTLWQNDGFGCFVVTDRPKMIFVQDPPTYKQHCKRIRFAFVGKFKRKCFRVFNKDDEKVIKYLNIKKMHRRLILQYVAREKNKRATMLKALDEIS